MKLNWVYTFFGLSLLAVIWLGNANGRAFSMMAGNTGAPGDQVQGNGQPWTCKTCHTSNAFGTAVAIEVKDGSGTSVNAYEPGTTYDVRITVNHNGNAQEFGFQALTLINAGNTEYNAWSAPASNVRLAVVDTSGRQYAEHFGPSSTNTFDVKWTAPAAGAGPVTIYAAGNATNNNNSSSGDNAATTSLTLVESIVNPTTDIPVSSLFSFAINGNPTEGQLNLDLFATSAADYSIIVRNLKGQSVMETTFSHIAGTFQRTLDVSHLTQGIYLLQLTDGKSSQTLKFLKI